MVLVYRKLHSDQLLVHVCIFTCIFFVMCRDFPMLTKHSTCNVHNPIGCKIQLTAVGRVNRKTCKIELTVK